MHRGRLRAGISFYCFAALNEIPAGIYPRVYGDLNDKATAKLLFFFFFFFL